MIDRPWKKTFAFFPVTTVSEKTIWLKTVYVRSYWIPYEFHMYPIVEYGDLFDVLQDP